jgi:hypothetical protein
MIHSRPGFATRTKDSAVAKLNDDMIPALHRKARPNESPLKHLEKTAREIAADILHEQMTADALAAAERSGPELLVNPAPSATPLVNEPGK